ncbi:hypothetical protein LTR08_005711 [Meristemomyces frigidus]|nr:hypothetical protein LTR08_005711 [Meristemomyces frigidus]
MATTFNSTPLFGGALTASLPSTFTDVSEMRQVPDHQEVWLDPNGFTSIVVEILERVEKPDLEALQHHLDDLVEEDAGEMKVWTSGVAHFVRLPQGTPAYTLLATTPPGAKQRGRAHEPEFVGVILMLVRLEAQKTDLIVAINVPHVEGSYDESGVDFEGGELGVLMGKAGGMRDEVVRTLEVRDWGLFGEGG